MPLPAGLGPEALNKCAPRHSTIGMMIWYDDVGMLRTTAAGKLGKVVRVEAQGRGSQWCGDPSVHPTVV